MGNTSAAHFVPYSSADQIERLVAAFLDGTLPCANWTHEAHLTVGLWHCRQFAPAEALDRIRAAILRYNGVCGVANTTSGGYHETLTRFYMQLLGDFLAAVKDRDDWAAITNALVARHGARDLPLRYYARERLMSPEARTGWLPPDDPAGGLVPQGSAFSGGRRDEAPGQ